MKTRKFLWLFLSLLIYVLPVNADIPGAASASEEAYLDGEMNIYLPCVGVSGLQYAVRLDLVSQEEKFRWKLGEQTVNNDFTWDNAISATLGSDLTLTIPSLRVGEQTYTLILARDSDEADPSGIYFKYLRHYARRADVGGFSDNHGTLSPYDQPVATPGAGRTLIAVYVVGSDLESRYGAATSDFNEMIAGYAGLTNPANLDVVIAFGGADRDGWRGMKFIDMPGLMEDGKDGV